MCVRSVCVECLIGKQKKPILFKVTEPSCHADTHYARDLVTSAGVCVPCPADTVLRHSTAHLRKL
jgi:hypothetical protein